MTVGFDVTWMDKDNKSGGVYQYAFRLISAIVEHTDTNVVAITGPTGKGIFEPLKKYKNFKEVPFGPPNSLLDIVKSDNIDVVHTPIQNLINFTLSVPMIITLHDLQHYYYPEFFTADEIKFRDFFYKLSAEFAERVIVSFQHAKEDIVRFYGIPAEKIDVCPLGTVSPKPIDNNKFQVIREKYKIPERYIFYSANTWRHKNHVSLIRALKILHEKYDLKISLICTGRQYPDYYPQILGEVNKLNLKDFVNFTGYIPEDDVKTLLKNSTLAVIPTLYEAGSFPLMEAMAYEVPVICSNVTSLPDTIRDKRFIFDPKDIEQIAEKAATLLKDEKLVQENRENSRIRVREGGWDKTVHMFLNVYSKAVEEFNKAKDIKALKNRMQIYESVSKGDLDALRNSYSWKITAPIRAVAAFLKKR
jgi:glycosyltransferase involved in cell wall biosynthesis